MCRTLTILGLISVPVTGTAAATSNTRLPSMASVTTESAPKTYTITFTTGPTNQMPSVVTRTDTNTKVLVGSTGGALPAFTSPQRGGTWRSFALVILVAIVAGVTQLAFSFRL
jgi:hypothetical protein